MGEGISFALGYGQVAAQAIQDAFARPEFSYATYRQRLLADPLFKQLDRRTRLAHIAYKARHPLVIRLGWQVARLVIRFTPWGNPDYKPVDPPEQFWGDIVKGLS